MKNISREEKKKKRENRFLLQIKQGNQGICFVETPILKNA